MNTEDFDEDQLVEGTEQALSTTTGAAADTVLRSGAPFSNDGKGGTLGVTSASVADVKRSIVKMNMPTIPAGQVLHSARLELKVVGISAGWLGGGIDLLRMTRAWQEGTGSGLTGNGATWVCANDTNTSILNFANNCAAADNWSMAPNGSFPQPFTPTATSRARVFTGGVTTVSFDVTADVQSFLNGTATNHGWMLAGFTNPLGGEWVNFGSREAFNAADRPQLIVEYGTDQCPSNPNKGVRGVCGCGEPEADTNYDGVVDCFGGIATATQDTTLRLAAPFTNDGRGAFLGTTSASILDIERALVRVDNSAIDAARNGQVITKAYLEMTVAGIAVGWAGGFIDLHRMNRSWVEGNPAGRGATWVCADDTDTTSLVNQFLNNCSSANTWGMQLLNPAQRPFAATPSARSGLVWPGMRTVRFDVTADVRDFLANPANNHGWMLQGGISNLLSGDWVKFGSRETGAPPRLLLELEPACPPGVQKTEPGVCGCYVADTDSDNDGTPDCVDACPANSAKTRSGSCGCNTPETDSDNDCLPDCIDPCPADSDTSAGGQCGCPSSPELAGTACGDSVSGDFETCDGAGHCGNPSADSPDPSCACRLIKAGENSYWFCPCARTRAQADQSCRSMPGQELIEIESASENDLIAGCLNQPAWTGANDLSAEGGWIWNTQTANEDEGFWDGDAVNGKRHNNRYANWRAGQPAGAPDCGAMDSRAAGGQWFAENCGNALAFVCEYEQSTIEPPPKTTDTCMILGTPCENDDPGPCVSQDSQFGSIDTQAEWQDAVDTCIDQDGQGCAPPLDQGPSGSCPSFTPTIDVTADGVVCPLDLDSTVNVNTLDLCDDPDQADQCPAGQQCGYAYRCSDCDPSTGNNCPPCTGDDQCGAGARCQPFLACGTPVCQYFCDNVPGSGGATCRFDDDCDPGVQCGWSKRCAQPDSQGNWIQCDRNEDCPAEPGASANQQRCVAYKACGEPREDCFRNYDASGETGGCSEVVLCGSLGDEGQTPVFEVTPVESEITAEDFGPEEGPDPATSKLIEMPACPVTNNCATSPVTVQGFNHPYCNYDVPGQIQGRSTDNISKPNKNSRAGSGKLKFGVEPELKLDFDVTAGPLGLIYPKASARAAFLADVQIDNLLTITKTLDIINVAAELRAGLRPDEDLCGIDPGESRVEIFEVNLLPADFLDDLELPGEAGRKQCLDAVKKFQDLVDRAKKAFFDAQVLIKEYYRRYNIDPANPLNRQTFPGPTIAHPEIPSLCELLVKEPPPAGFDAATPNCHDEKPEDTINRFIRFYNKQVETLVNEGVGSVATAIDRSLADAIDNPATTSDGLAWKIPIAKLHDLEEVVILNQTFLVGPIPVLLQVLFTVEYGFQLDAEVAMRVGTALKNALAWTAESLGEPVVKAGLSGAPYAQAGVGLFVGIGFDIGIASASVGIQGNLTLGRISLPVHAGAGITMDVVDDRRTEEQELPAYLKELADIAPLRLSFPMRKFTFGLRFQYGADLKLEKILQGSIDLRVRVKFFFFSKTWRKNIVKFPGLATIEFPLFSGGADWKGGKWGTVEMPMPFVTLSEIEVREPVKDSQPVWTNYAHEQFLFDSQCDCIETFETVTDPVEQDELRSCARNADCCDKDQNNPPIVCFQDPADGGKGKCTACRDPGSWGTSGEFGVPATPGDTCVDDEDCCPGTRCLDKQLVTGQSSTERVCMPLSYCDQGGGPCDSNDDCGGIGSVCTNNECTTCTPP